MFGTCMLSVSPSHLPLCAIKPPLHHMEMHHNGVLIPSLDHNVLKYLLNITIVLLERSFSGVHVATPILPVFLEVRVTVQVRWRHQVGNDDNNLAFRETISVEMYLREKGRRSLALSSRIPGLLHLYLFQSPNTSLVGPKKHFCLLRCNPQSLSVRNTASKCFKCSASSFPDTNISSTLIFVNGM